MLFAYNFVYKDNMNRVCVDQIKVSKVYSYQPMLKMTIKKN